MMANIKKLVCVECGKKVNIDPDIVVCPVCFGQLTEFNTPKLLDEED